MSGKKSKKYFIKTFGCYANEADSDLIAGVLESFGFEELKVPLLKLEYGQKRRNDAEEVAYVVEKADILVVNSCSVRQKSEDKVYGLGKILKNNKKRKAVAVLTGCMVGSALGERKRFPIGELKKKTENYNAYFSPGDIKSFIKILKEFNLVSGKEDLGERVVEKRQKDENHAFVNISYGCDNFCSYCVVPYSRGCEVSRSEEDILAEIECLVKKGTTEFTLCGQNVNSWGLNKEEKFKVRSAGTVGGIIVKKKLPFAQLLENVHKIEGVKKIDFISSNPFDFSQDLVDVLKLPKISKYIHVAAQSGNDDILKSMNRRHSAEEFINLIERIRKVKPGIEIGTDLIVGYPGETREQFMDTVKLVKKAKFAVAFISMYSPRKGTYAQINLEDDVPLKEKKWRHMYLTKVWKSTKNGKGKNYKQG